MPIVNRRELLAFLSSHEIRAKRGLSQNFLIEGNIVEKLLTLASLTSDDCVLEIGPGPGAITEALLQRVRHVVAVEKDPILAGALERFQNQGPGCLAVSPEDILECDVASLMRPYLSPGEKFKVVANLPFQISTPILTRLLPLFPIISSLTLILQREYGDRLVAEPDTKEYSSLSIFRRFYSDIRGSFPISARCFYPPPKVGSIVVSMELKPPPVKEDQTEGFFKLSRTLFGQRRKMIRGPLSSLYTDEECEKAFSKSGISPERRPGTLSLEDMLSLYSALSS